jgi:hypothetical protein
MNTTTLLRECMHQLEAAHAEAVMEYGALSEQADQIADAVFWMREWMARYHTYTGDTER